ncbi:TonB-dependent receptor [soil metagenome]
MASEKRFVSFFAVGVSLLALSAPAFAQDKAANAAPAPAAPTDAADQSGPSVADIVVTGSRIVRDGYTAPTPVTVATTEDLLKSTPSSIPDALNKLPQFSNSLSPSKSALNFSNSPIHGNVLNLRGLGTPGVSPKGPLRTLILFDGIRVSPTEYVGTIDTNVLPQLLMQRVDVVTGGASAQWGSDAVAGVVNFILDKKFTGFKGVAQAGVSQRGDNANHRLGAAYGSDFGNGRGHVLISGEYSKSDGMIRNDRDYATRGYAFVGSTSTALGAPGTAANPYTIGTNILISAIAPNGRIVGSSVAGNPFVGQVINNDGSTRPFNTGTAVGSAGIQSGGDGYKIPDYGNAVAPLKTYQTFGRLSYDLTDDISAFVQGAWSRSDMTYSTQTNGLVAPSNGVNIYKGNPYLSSALNASLTGPTDSISVSQYDAGQPSPVAKERTDYWMVTAGLTGKLATLNWSANYSHGDSTHTLANSGLYDNKKLYAAVDAVVNPANGQITCRVLLDPTVASQYTGCQPLNVLNGNPATSTPAGYAYATGTSRYRATIRQDSFTANLSGSLFDLPAGPVDFAIGGEYRKQSLNLTSNAAPSTLVGTSTDPVILAAQTAAIRANYFAGLRGVPSGAGIYWLTNVGTAQGSLNVKEAYAELAVPILKDKTFFQELSLNGAARITDYSTSGTVKTWKVGATWRPIRDLLFRGTLSRDIRAPNLFELFAGAQSGIGIINDLKTANGSYGSGLNQNVTTITSGNPNLKPEIAKTLTIGGVFTPSAIRGLSLSVDYYRINVNNLIDSLSGQQIVTNCYNAGGSGVPECSLITRTTPTSLPTQISIVPANISYLKTAGIDIDASYRRPVGEGLLGLRLYANYLAKFDSQQYIGAPVAHYAGVSVVSSNPAGYAKWRGNFSVDYTNGPFGVTIAEQYIGKMRLDIPGGALPIAFVNPKVKPVVYTDLSFRFTIPQSGGKFEFFGNINNLFDKQPPIIPGITPGVNLPTNIAVYDFVGRAFTAGVRVNF